MSITDISSAAAAALEQVAPSVVRVGRGGGRGCGVVVRPGQVVTNAHNLRGPEVTIGFGDGRQVIGSVAGVDLDGDLAVVAVDTGEVPPAPLADGPLPVGSAVFAVARSAAGGARVSFGIVSASERTFRGPRGRQISGTVEHTAPLPRGSSGSPVVDATGRVVGFNTNRLGDGFYLALPADAELQRRIDALAAGDSPVTPRLGVGLAPAHVARKLRRSVGLPDRDGLLVRVVDDGSPADRAGVRAGDLIVAADGTAVDSVDALFAALDGAARAGTVSLRLVRGADELDVRVDLGAGGARDEGAV